jgi:hypothetical protein
MPDISEITLPSGTTYNIKDAQARQAKGWIGITTTALTDGATTNPITINGQSVTAGEGDITSYDEQELIFNGTVWQEFGDLSDLGTLAYKDSASGSYTPQGSVAAPDITVSPTTDTIKPVTDVGSMPTFTVSGETLIIEAGAVPTLGADKAFMTGASATASAPAFSGTPSTVTVS